MQEPLVYHHLMDHLQDELARLDVIIGSEIEHMNAEQSADNSMDTFRGMFMSETEAVHLLEGERSFIRLKAEQKLFIRQMDNLIAERVEGTRAAGKICPIHRLQHIYQLNDLALRMLIAAIAPHVNGKYLKLYAYLHDDMTKQYLSVDLLLRLTCTSLQERRIGMSYLMDDSSRLRELLQVGDAPDDPNGSGESILLRPVRMDERIAYYILGLDWQHEGSLAYLTLLPCDDELPPMYGRKRQHEHIAGYSEQLVALGQAWVGMVYGPPGSGKTHLTRLVGNQLGKPILEWDVAYAPEDEAAFVRDVDAVFREARLHQAITAINNVQKLTSSEREDTRADRRFKLLLTRMFKQLGIFFLHADRELKPAVAPPATHVWQPIELRIPELGERIELWHDMSKGSFDLTLQEAAELAGKFQFSPGMIRQTMLSASQLAGWIEQSKEESGMAETNRLQLLHKSAYRLIQHRLTDKAIKTEAKVTWHDLILPPETKGLLRQAANRLKHRHTVMHQWGMERKLPYGKGISMLFTGPPGTGKTMSAMVMAKEMNAELYRIDLSRVVSKYIGETEKNLSEIFDQAKLSGAILFFDEADALFGKRSEVKDAHDKYANMETSYLLQKMEEYEGLTILATNFSQNLDDAFLRRIQFIIKFPFPNAEQREQLWRSFITDELPISDIDYDYLAKSFELSGGPIKNIVLTAAYLAAEEGGCISMKQIIEAVIQEYKKTGKVIMKDHLGAYADYWKG